ncbi:MAG: alpha-2-macroglobulin, partial [Methylocystis sp.]
MKNTFLALLAAASLVLFAPAPRAEPQSPPTNFDRVQRADGAHVVPEKFLRDWDPVTIFFDSDAGPKNGGPADAHEKFAILSPEPAGEWRWLGPRALQFRPAEPWTPLARVLVKSGSSETRLVALLPTPSSTTPADGADPIPELTQIALTFPSPVEAKALARLLAIEIRPSPGVSKRGGRALSSADFDILPLERSKRSAEQSYVIKFREAIADGQLAIVRLKLADEPGFDEETFELRVRTATPFAVVDTTCGRGWNDDKIDGVLRCASNGAASPAPESGAEEGGDTSLQYEPANKRRLSLRFSAEPAPLDILRAREALRVTPPVDDLSVEVDRQRLKITAKFLSDRVYELNIAPGALHDARGRALAGAFTQRFVFTRDAPALQWDAGFGIVERLGPQVLPLRGRGVERADIRIHAIDPLSRDFWPFPDHGVDTADADAPPLPGNEPKAWSGSADIEAEAIKERIKALGSPAVSRLAILPLRRDGADARFGIDLSEDFARIRGREQPGAYLVG